MAEPLVIAAGVAAGVTARGVAFVTRDREIELELELDAGAEQERARIARWLRGLRALARGGDAALLTAGRDAAALLAQLRAAEVLVPASGDGDDVGASALSAAIVAASKPRVTMTAEEGLVLPRDVAPRESTAILRAFVAAMTSPLRLELYAMTAMAGEATVLGDVPEPAHRAALERVLGDLDPRKAHVVRFRDAQVESFDADEVLAPTSVPGRLRIVGSVSDQAAVAGGHVTSAAYACPDLRFASERGPRRAYGTAPTRELARTIAATEAVERFACGDVRDEWLRRATARDLPGAVHGDRLIRFSARQYEGAGAPTRFDPAREIAWAPATTEHGAERWVPAELVFTPYVDQVVGAAIGQATTSGVAADERVEVARRRALLELVERDAFMWTWLQRLRRASIALTSLPVQLRHAVESLAAEREVRFVDLTLDTKPVVLCAVVSATGHGIGTAAADDPAVAAARAFAEATAGYVPDGDPDRLPPTSVVRLPADHRRWYGSPARREHARFLWSGTEEVGLDELRGDDRPVGELVAGIGEPVFVMLRPAGRGPLHVVRALVPGLVPLTFGHDADPLGVPRVGAPVATRSGRTLGRRIDVDALTDLPPHPLA